MRKKNMALGIRFMNGSSFCNYGSFLISIKLSRKRRPCALPCVPRFKVENKSNKCNKIGLQNQLALCIFFNSHSLARQVLPTENQLHNIKKVALLHLARDSTILHLFIYLFDHSGSYSCTYTVLCHWPMSSGACSGYGKNGYHLMLRWKWEGKGFNDGFVLILFSWLKGK